MELTGIQDPKSNAAITLVRKSERGIRVCASLVFGGLSACSPLYAADINQERALDSLRLPVYEEAGQTFVTPRRVQTYPAAQLLLFRNFTKIFQTALERSLSGEAAGIAHVFPPELDFPFTVAPIAKTTSTLSATPLFNAAYPSQARSKLDICVDTGASDLPMVLCRIEGKEKHGRSLVAAAVESICTLNHEAEGMFETLIARASNLNL